MRNLKHLPQPNPCRPRVALRRGAATLDFVLVLGMLLPIAGLCVYLGGTIIKLAYEMICVLVSWPFM